MTGFTIIKSDQALAPRNTFTVIYGLPGVGKTSLSFTFKKPVLHLDFDNGISRAFQMLRPDSTQVTNYGEFHKYVMSDEFEKLIQDGGYKTVVIDTIGTMLDNYIAPWLIRKDPKNGRGGGLSLQGWGQLSTTFNMFKSRIFNMGLDLVAICHAKEEGEDKQFRLAVKGGSTDIIHQSSDMIGFMHVQGRKRLVDFNPTQMHIGKNTAQLDELAVPNGEEDPDKYGNFGEWILEQCAKRMTEASEAQLAAKEAVEQYKQSIDEAGKATKKDQPGAFTAIVAGLADEPNQTVKAQVRNLLSDALKAAELKYDKESATVIAIAKKEPKEADQEENKEPAKEEADANA